MEYAYLLKKLTDVKGDKKKMKTRASALCGDSKGVSSQVYALASTTKGLPFTNEWAGLISVCAAACYDRP